MTETEVFWIKSLMIYYVICSILVPIAICRIWHWSYRCAQELQELNEQIKLKNKGIK